MRQMVSLGMLSVVLLGAVSCGEHDTVALRAPGVVPKGSFALVGDRALSLSLLSASPDARTIQAEGIVQEVLLGDEAARTLPHRSQAVERGVLGRSLLNHLERELLQQAPITDEEISKQRQKEWMKYDRPRAVRVAQFYIPVQRLSPGDAEYALAESIQAAVKGATNVEGFVSAGQAVETELQVVVEPAPAVAADGRVVPILSEESEFENTDVAFAKAATDLQFVGDISGVIATEAGFHILYAMEIFPGVTVSEVQARSSLMKTALAERMDARLEAIKKERSVPVVRVRTEVASILRRLWREQ